MRIKVGIRPFVPFEPLSGQVQNLSLAYHEFTALIDTGALRTCVTQNVVDKLQLKRRGRIDVGNVKRTETHWTYLFHVAIWPHTEDGSAATVYGIGDEVEGIDVGDSRYYDVLLGMDILSRGALSLEKDGNFELVF